MPTESPLLVAARSYCQRGWSVVPIPLKKKGPILRAWQTLRLSEGQLFQHFNGTGNIGIILGSASGGLVDVDLDCPEAIEKAGQFLPPTEAKTGRASALSSHWWYRLSAPTPPMKFVWPATKKTIVELRSDGQQTVVGPSVHPSGELYDILDGTPAEVDSSRLIAALTALADEIRGPQAAPIPGPAPSDVEKRAIAYLATMAPAISGSGGHNATYAAATVLVHGFGLSKESALWLLIEHYNSRCVPPWSDRQLAHKVADAASKPHDRPHGWLLERPEDLQGVDLSGFRMETAFPGSKTARKGESAQDYSIITPKLPAQFPTHLLSVPGFIGELMAWNLATATRPQPILALSGAIALQAVLAGRKVRDERGGRTNLYIVNVGESGSGKDHARKCNKSILFEAGLQALEGPEDLASDAGLMSSVESSPAILFQLDEFGRFLQTIGDPRRMPHLYNVIGVLMKLFSSAGSIYTGKAYAERNKNRAIDQPCVSVLGTTIPENFYDALTAASLSDGFMGRVLVFEGVSIPSRERRKLEKVPASLVKTAVAWGDVKCGGNLSGDHPQPHEVPYTHGAAQVFDRFASEADEAGKTPVGRALWSRAEEKACRLALIYACSAASRMPLEINRDAATWACELSGYLTRRILELAGEWVADGVFDSKQKRVIRIIRDSGGRISRSDLCRKCQFLTQRERKEILDNLVETCCISVEVEETITRKSIVYQLNF